ncbi:hypothetical protein Bpfe_009734 [Biomphalaria pfeifferi]|uniref:EGF-like domain-containing protein n=1 Tax=Biomphalaria pfeifferi TaxID=112525 RepID=A0AAD8BUE6_BIOPF|nr:hypothetical protein Bpfe_009734 [Biomphalaria pfeifferi]
MEISNKHCRSGRMYTPEVHGKSLASESQCSGQSLKHFNNDKMVQDSRTNCSFLQSHFHSTDSLASAPSSSRHATEFLRNFLIQSVSGVFLSLTKKQSSNCILLAVFLITVSALVCPNEARSVGVCNGIPCANGGKLLVSNSVWGNCRCKCPPGFVGPYCQYQAARKISVVTTNSINNLLSERAQILKLIRERHMRMSQRLREEMIEDESSTEEESKDDTSLTEPSE